MLLNFTADHVKRFNVAFFCRKLLSEGNHNNVKAVTEDTTRQGLGVEHQGQRQGLTLLVPNSTSRTPDTDMLYNTTIGQKFAASQHLDMSRCWALVLRCGKFVVQQVVELL